MSCERGLVAHFEHVAYLAIRPIDWLIKVDLKACMHLPQEGPTSSDLLNVGFAQFNSFFISRIAVVVDSS